MKYFFIEVLCQLYKKQGSYGQGKPGKPEKVREFQNDLKVGEFFKIFKNLENFKITQKNKKTI